VGEKLLTGGALVLDLFKGPRLQSDIKALVFDLDGTLYSCAPLGGEILLSAVRYVAEMKAVGLGEAEQLLHEAKKRLTAASGNDTTLSRACMDLGGDLRELHRRFAAEIRPERFLAEDTRVTDLLKTLGSRFELYLYTNNNRPLAVAIMELLGVIGLFRQIFTIEESWRPKPDRIALEDIFLRIGRTPEECLFVGDRYDIDLRLPAEMGCAVCLVSTTEELFHLCTLMKEENV
jgi:putative hydrolase of the HAD superfamily